MSLRILISLNKEAASLLHSGKCLSHRVTLTSDVVLNVSSDPASANQSPFLPLLPLLLPPNSSTENLTADSSNNSTVYSHSSVA